MSTIEQGKHILKMIEDYSKECPFKRTATARDINKAVAKFLGWFYYTPSEAKKKFKRFYKKGAWIHPDDCASGNPVFCQLHGTEIHRDCPNYVHSRDALKPIRPEGYRLDIAQSNIHKDFRVSLLTLKSGKSHTGKFLPTEELAELHAIIQAIMYEREQDAHTKI